MMMMITNQILVSVVLCVFVSTILDGVNDFIFYLFFLLSFLFDKCHGKGERQQHHFFLHTAR